MQWDDLPGAGFTTPGVRSWLPIGDSRATNVTSQRNDRASMLHFVRDLIAFRRSQPDLTVGTYQRLPAPARGWAYQRGTGTIVAINLSDTKLTFPGMAATVRFSTARGLIDGGNHGELQLEPWEGVICSSDST
jgi:glycosidase